MRDIIISDEGGCPSSLVSLEKMRFHGVVPELKQVLDNTEEAQVSLNLWNNFCNPNNPITCRGDCASTARVLFCHPRMCKWTNSIDPKLG